MISASPPIRANSGRTSTLHPATKASAAMKTRPGGRDRLACDQQTIIHQSSPR